MTEPKTLDAWLCMIEARHPIKWDLGLARIRQVAQRLAVLEPAKRTVLVAGTNGKGSTCEYLAKLAQASGWRVGLSTSPHLLCFNERIRIQGEPARDAAIIAAFRAIERARAEISLSYFEFATLASLLLFKQASLDLAALEIGLGGRLDAMNIVDPALSVITSISLDHQAWLGDSREAIGKEKAGILRHGKPCVLADSAPPASILAESERLGAPLYLLGRDFDYEGEARRLHWRSPKGGIQRVDQLPSPRLPPESLAAAVQVGALLGLNTGAEPLRRLAAGTCLAGRSQVIKGRPDILLDVAHNPAAAQRLADQVRALAPAGRRVHALAGVYADKDLPGVLSPLAPLVASWRFCDLPEERAAPATQLAKALPPGHASQAQTCGSIGAAMSQLHADCGPDDLAVVFGSFPMVAGALQTLKGAGRQEWMSN